MNPEMYIPPTFNEPIFRPALEEVVPEPENMSEVLPEEVPQSIQESQTQNVQDMYPPQEDQERLIVEHIHRNEEMPLHVALERFTGGVRGMAEGVIGLGEIAIRLMR